MIGSDVAMSVSWHDISIPPGDWTLLSFLLRSGNNYVNQRVITVLASAPYVVADDHLAVDLIVSDVAAGSVVRVFLVVNGDT
jgi:hypothetical protein